MRVSLASLLAYALVSGWGWFNATTSNSFLIAWASHGVCSGCFFTSAASIGQRLYPHDRFAQFASVAGMVVAPANMALGPLVGLLIEQTGLVYRHTFIVASLPALTALVLGVGVHRRVLALGGPKNYVAPEK